MQAFITWVEIPANDIDRAAAFYSAVFEQPLEIVEQGPRRMALLTNAEAGKPGCSILHTEGFSPNSNGPLAYFSVESLDSVLERVRAAGGNVQVAREPMGTFGDFATFNDSEGNTIALFSAA